jgi:3-hydroxyacyl-[acyl-carrier-protein] dehydratase
MTPDACHESFRIEPGHPALPGHFPGRPVVPGVVLLDRVAAALERWRGTSPATLTQVKFLQPLLPGQTADLELRQAGGRVAFRISHGGVDIASGSIEAA